MKLRPISTGANSFWFICAGCDGRASSVSGHADLDGAPFAAYYCASCALLVGKTEENDDH